MKNLFIPLGLILLGCINEPAPKEPPTIPPEEIETPSVDYFDNILEFYTFELKNIKKIMPFYKPAEIYGKGFIADGEFWSAAHLFSITRIRPDVVNLGKSSIFGLARCKYTHKKGDFLHYKTIKRGDIQAIILEIEEFSYLVSLDKDILGGDSGSPVLCKDHEKVLGVVSSFWSNHKEFRRAGNIAKFPEKKNQI